MTSTTSFVVINQDGFAPLFGTKTVKSIRFLIYLALTACMQSDLLCLSKRFGVGNGCTCQHPVITTDHFLSVLMRQLRQISIPLNFKWMLSLHMCAVCGIRIIRSFWTLWLLLRMMTQKREHIFNFLQCSSHGFTMFVNRWQRKSSSTNEELPASTEVNSHYFR